jgi:hypothetical protein
MQNNEQNYLYERLRQWHPDDSQADFPFSRRLARENGWTHSYARCVIEEYKRFVFLAVHAGHPVTPSGPVDQAWHLHLTFTRSYWEDLCETILHQPLHHTPTKGGRKEGEKFEALYNQTVQSYRRFFNAEPPDDIWPAPTGRFAEARHQRWINTRQYWVVPKPLINLPLDKNSIFALLASSSLPGCAVSGKSNPVVLFTLLWAVGLSAAVLVFVWLARPGRRRNGKDAADSGSFGTGDSGSNGTSSGMATAGFAGMAGGHFGGGGSGDSFDGTSGDSADGSGDSGCSGGCSGCGGGD